jgi:hypothetical protein
MRRICLWLLPALLGGCSGEYLMTAPDIAGNAGETAPAVVRLQRREFWRYCPPAKEIPVQFRMTNGPLCAARTDEAGYAGMSMTLPKLPGRYEIAISLQDPLGDTAEDKIVAYVLNPNKPIVVVDYDSLPIVGGDALAAAAALTHVAQDAQILYLSEKDGQNASVARQRLTLVGFPEGAVLPYAKSHWQPPYAAKSSPKALESLRQRFKNITYAIAADEDSAEAFYQVGLKILAVKDPAAKKHAAQFFTTWQELNLPK